MSSAIGQNVTEQNGLQQLGKQFTFRKKYLIIRWTKYKQINVDFNYLANVISILLQIRKAICCPSQKLFALEMRIKKNYSLKGIIIELKKRKPKYTDYLLWCRFQYINLKPIRQNHGQHVGTLYVSLPFWRELCTLTYRPQHLSETLLLIRPFQETVKMGFRKSQKMILHEDGRFAFNLGPHLYL